MAHRAISSMRGPVDSYITSLVGRVNALKETLHRDSASAALLEKTRKEIMETKIALVAATGKDWETLCPAPPDLQAHAESNGKKKRRRRRRGALRVPVNTPPPPPESFPDLSATRLGSFSFEVLHQSRRPGSRARVGRIHTPHGVIDTPGFVPVATNAALKAVDHRTSDAVAGTQLIFSNTLHLMVHPGTDVIREAGGIHRYIGGRNRPMITDSGGFQLFSLGATEDTDGPELKSRNRGGSGSGGGGGTTAARKQEGEKNREEPRDGSHHQHQRQRPGLIESMDEGGVTFRSYRDGRRLRLTPESSVQAQQDIGADIIVPLDELPPHHVSRERLEESVNLSHRWMARSLREHLKGLYAGGGGGGGDCPHPAQHPVRVQAMYGIIHGGTDRQLREQSARYLSALPFDGLAIGGSLGKDREDMCSMLDFLAPLLPPDRPRHLLGIGDPTSLRQCVPLAGIDTFDSCLPTRNARHGTLFLRDGSTLRIGAAKYARDYGPIDSDLPGTTGDPLWHHHGQVSRAYLHHLYKAHEPLYDSLASLHNLTEMMQMMSDMRAAILRDEI